MGIEELDESQLMVADVTQDNTISALDASAIAQYVVNIIDFLPVSNMDAIHKNITDSRLEFYEGGHLFLIQDKKAFQDLVDWLL